MATITQKITIDVARANVFSAIIGKQFDTDSRFLQCTLAQEGVAMEIESGVTVSINARRPDNTTSSFAGERNADGTVTVPIDEWILEQNGMVSLSVSIVSANGEKLTSCTFYLNVQQAEGEGWLWVFTATDVVATGTYHINFGGTDYEFTLPTALESGDKIYFSSALDYAKSVEPTGAEIDTMILTVGSGGTALVSSELINFLASLESELASYNSRVESVEDALDTKADKSGQFEDLTAGTAQAVIDKNSYTPSTSPYLYRQSPSGKRCEYDVIGGSVGQNQNIALNRIRDSRAIQGVQFTNNGDGSVTINGTATGTTYDAGMWATTAYDTTHVYFCRSYTEKLTKGTSGVADHGQFAIESGRTYNATLYPCRIDLTTLLGSTIADYAYSLEQATAGTGIAWLKSFGFLSKSYYPYSEPTLESVQATARVARGINQWDEEWELGSLNTNTGGNYPSTNEIRSKNYVSILPSTTYYNSCSQRIVICFYDENKAFIAPNISVATNMTFRTQANARYMRFYVNTAYGTTYLNDICINISNPTINGQYFPYESHTYPLGEITLRGIPKLDSSNNIYYDGDVYKASGEITRRYGVVDLGSLSWTATSSDTAGYNRFVSVETVGVNTAPGAIGNVRCAKYIAITGNDAYSRITGVTLASTGKVVIYDEALAQGTASAFKTAMSGVYLVYELATPTTETTDSFTPIQYTGSTEEFSTDNDVPVGVEGKYYNDTEEVRDEQVSGILRHLLTLTKNVPFANSTVVDLGNLSWTYANGRFNSSTLPNAKTTGARGGSIILTNGYTFTGQEGGTPADKSCFIGITGYPYLYVYDSSYTDATTFKQAMSGVLLAYETT